MDSLIPTLPLLSGYPECMIDTTIDRDEIGQDEIGQHEIGQDEIGQDEIGQDEKADRPVSCCPTTS